MLGKRLRLLRSEKDITQRELAKYLGLTPKMISFYENGERFPPYDIIIKLSKYFDVSADYLLGLTDVKKPIDKISEALEEDEGLFEFWNELKEREELQLLFKQTRSLDKKTIQQVIRIIKAIEDEESRG